MHISILHYAKPNTSLYRSTKLLRQKGKEMGHKIKTISRYDCQLDFTQNHLRILYKNKPFPKTDVIICRPAFNMNYELEAGIIKHLQYCGYTVVNTHLAVIITKNKIRTLQYLHKNHIPIPKTMVVHKRDDLELAAEKIGQLPLIIKTACGTHGRGVIYIPDSKSMRSIMDVLMGWQGQEFLIQEYIEEAKGKDLRIFIVGGKVIAAMERIAQPEEFRANFHLGGEVQKVDLNYEEKNLAMKAAKAIGIEICGVDMLRTNTGPKIIEVNSNPGLEGIMQATGIDIPSAIIKYAVKKGKLAQTKKIDKKNNIV